MLKISRRFRFKFQSSFFKDLEGLRRWKWVIFQERKAGEGKLNQNRL
jgi:hypothetical protein